jgi:F420-non-reducing hydrogenase small subunit
VTEVELDPETCFLAQGVICLGPATRDGCGETCIDGNMPCTGCLGPTDGARDQGAKMIAALGGILEGEDPESVDRATSGLVDAAGTFYRYGLSSSLLGRARDKGRS